ncbi:MAG: AMP-binding protein [Myxococcota bacterium]
MSPPADLLTGLAEAQPEKIALIDDRPSGDVVKVNFADFEAEANRLAHALRAAGLRPGDKMVWCGQNSLRVVALMHAARKAQLTAVPLNYRLTPDEAAYVVDNCDAALVAVDAEFGELIDRIAPKTPKVHTRWVFDGDAAVCSGARALDAVVEGLPTTPPDPAEADTTAATMIYTSGTTGKPKGALRHGSGDPEQMTALMTLIGYQPDDIYLTTGPLYHSGPSGFMALAQALGNTVILQRKFNPEDWLRLVDRYQVTSTFSAPTPIRLVCNLPDEVKARYDRSTMQRMVANAAPWSFALKEAYLADFPEESLFEVYGSTELGVNTVMLPKDQRRKPGSCGQASPFVELALFDDDGNRVTEPNVPGELFARSRSVFTTYYKADEKYQEDKRGPFHTVGDVAYIDEEGFVFICDRKKDMIISGGMNIYPAEIEGALERHPAIIDVAVFGIPSEDWGESVHAVVVHREAQPVSEGDVIAYAREHLASYKIPRSVSFVSEIPRTGSGKILKRVLREPYWKDHGSFVA